MGRTKLERRAQLRVVKAISAFGGGAVSPTNGRHHTGPSAPFSRCRLGSWELSRKLMRATAASGSECGHLPEAHPLGQSFHVQPEP